jgi:hypothetical protein
MGIPAFHNGDFCSLAAGLTGVAPREDLTSRPSIGTGGFCFWGDIPLFSPLIPLLSPIRGVVGRGVERG